MTEAYTVLNDPQKREMYDEFGHADFDDGLLDTMFGMAGSDFDQFQDFIDEMLLFDSMLDFFDKAPKRKPRKKGRAPRGGRTGFGGAGEMDDLDDLMGMLADELSGMGGQLNSKGRGKAPGRGRAQASSESDSEFDSDDGELTQDELDMLAFAEINVSTHKAKKKTFKACRICEQKIKEDELLIHFGEHHAPDFVRWQKTQVRQRTEKAMAEAASNPEKAQRKS